MNHHQDSNSIINTLNYIYISNNRQIERLISMNSQVQTAIIGIANRSEPRNYNQANPQVQNNRRNHSRQTNTSRQNHTGNRATGYNSISHDAEIRNAMSYLLNQNTRRLFDASSNYFADASSNYFADASSNYSRWDGSFLTPYQVPVNTPAVSRGNTMPNTPLMRNFFDPVAIFPTQEQINSATRTVRYGDILNPLNSSCPISLDVLTDDTRVVIIRHCGHIFKEHEFGVWFRSNCKCPVCRYDIRTNNTNVVSIGVEPPTDEPLGDTAIEHIDISGNDVPYTHITIDISGNITDYLTQTWLSGLFNPTA